MFQRVPLQRCDEFDSFLCCLVIVFIRVSYFPSGLSWSRFGVGVVTPGPGSRFSLPNRLYLSGIVLSRVSSGIVPERHSGMWGGWGGYGYEKCTVCM